MTYEESKNECQQLTAARSAILKEKQNLKIREKEPLDA
jgi:hypothetical protein